jgi:hypothetical protein
MNRCFVRDLSPAAMLCLLLTSACAHALPAAGSNETDPSPAGVCSAREVARDSLLVEGGRALYVQPVILEPNGRGDALLAGDISFMLERRDGRWRFTREDSTFGAIIPAAGEPVVVPAPIPTRLIGGSRALARADGAWDVVFAQVHDYTGESRPYTVERLWHGVLDGPRWTHLEPVPLPAGIGDTLDVTFASPLLRVADTLFWAAPLKRPGPRAVALFSRRDGAWGHEVVPTVLGSYPRLAYSDSLGLVLAMVGPDRTLPSDGNSLILWTRRPEWRPHRKLVSSSREQVHDPWISLAPGREVVGWAAGVEDEAGARTEAHAMWGELSEAAPVAVLDSALHPHGQFSVRPLEFAPRVRLWVFEHWLADHIRELRVVQESAGAPVLLASVPSAFPAGFMAALPAPGQLLVAGAEYDAAEQMIVSLLVRFQVDCSSP